MYINGVTTVCRLASFLIKPPNTTHRDDDGEWANCHLSMPPPPTTTQDTVGCKEDTSRKSQMMIVSSCELLMIWKSSNCSRNTRPVCSCTHENDETLIPPVPRPHDVNVNDLNMTAISVSDWDSRAPLNNILYMKFFLSTLLSIRRRIKWSEHSRNYNHAVIFSGGNS